MFLKIKSQKILQNLKIFSDGSLSKDFLTSNYLKLKINFLEKDFKFKLKQTSKSKTQRSNFLNTYRKNIFK